MSTRSSEERPTRRVAFVVSRDGVGPEWLTQAIGAPPDSTRFRPDRTPVQGTWEITSQGSGHDALSTMIGVVLDRVRMIQDRLAPVCAREDTACILRVTQYIADDDVGPGFYVSPENIALLAALDVTLDVDQYWLAPDGD